jgi:hypothetical protein
MAYVDKITRNWPLRVVWRNEAGKILGYNDDFKVDSPAGYSYQRATASGEVFGHKYWEVVKMHEVVKNPIDRTSDMNITIKPEKRKVVLASPRRSGALASSYFSDDNDNI